MKKKQAAPVQALMVNIAWTTAKVVRIRATQDFTLEAYTVEFVGKQYGIVAEAAVRVTVGSVLYFVRSDGFPGFYYLLRYNGTAFTCTCPLGATFHKACEHQASALAFVTAKYDHRHAVERLIDEDWQAHVEDDVRMARMERVYENLVSAA